MQKQRGKRKVFVGKVVSAKMDKTIVVEVTRLVRHSLYPKTLRATSRFKAHDEKNLAKEGDLVEIMETRPLSKTKRWRLVRILSQKEGEE